MRRPAHTCGFPVEVVQVARWVQDSRPCRRPVKEAGTRCWQHVSYQDRLEREAATDPEETTP